MAAKRTHAGRPPESGHRRDRRVGRGHRGVRRADFAVAPHAARHAVHRPAHVPVPGQCEPASGAAHQTYGLAGAIPHARAGDRARDDLRRPAGQSAAALARGLHECHARAQRKRPSPLGGRALSHRRARLRTAGDRRGAHGSPRLRHRGVVVDQGARRARGGARPRRGLGAISYAPRAEA